jgi:uncharacterized surface protein with fasciclin (FAS1) repeats
MNTIRIATAGLVLFAGAGFAHAHGCSSHESAAKTASVKSEPTIVDVAVGAGSFETLVTAVKAAGLVETLSGEGPFTVFAPTDEAFAKLPAGTVESLLKDKDALTRVLTYHVVAGKVTSDQVVKIDEAPTVLGETLPIDTRHGVKVGNAKVVQADVMAGNGVIHVIDTVLLPPAMRSGM